MNAATAKFVIYNARNQVMGFVQHLNGERAVDKAEDVIGANDLLWDRWENASTKARKAAEKLGAIT